MSSLPICPASPWAHHLHQCRKIGSWHGARVLPQSTCQRMKSFTRNLSSSSNDVRIVRKIIMSAALYMRALLNRITGTSQFQGFYFSAVGFERISLVNPVLALYPGRLTAGKIDEESRCRRASWYGYPGHQTGAAWDWSYRRTRKVPHHHWLQCGVT